MGTHGTVVRHSPRGGFQGQVRPLLDDVAEFMIAGSPEMNILVFATVQGDRASARYSLQDGRGRIAPRSSPNLDNKAGPSQAPTRASCQRGHSRDVGGKVGSCVAGSPYGCEPLVPRCAPGPKPEENRRPPPLNSVGVDLGAVGHRFSANSWNACDGEGVGTP